jgi:hypothetical protein
MDVDTQVTQVGQVGTVLDTKKSSEPTKFGTQVGQIGTALDTKKSFEPTNVGTQVGQVGTVLDTKKSFEPTNFGTQVDTKVLATMDVGTKVGNTPDADNVQDFVASIQRLVGLGEPSLALEEACCSLCLFSDAAIEACDYDDYIAAFVQAAKIFDGAGIEKAPALDAALTVLLKTVRDDVSRKCFKFKPVQGARAFSQRHNTKFIEARGLEVLVGIIKEASWPFALVQKGCRLLYRLTSCNPNARELCGEAGGVEAVLGLVARYPNHLDGKVMNLLNSVTSNNVANLAKVGVAGIPIVVDFILKIPNNKDVSLDDALRSAYVVLKGAFWVSADNKTKFVTEGGVKVVLDTIERYGNHTYSWDSIHACEVLDDVVRDSPDNTAEFVDAGGCEIMSGLVRFIKTHLFVTATNLHKREMWKQTCSLASKLGRLGKACGASNHATAGGDKNDVISDMSFEAQQVVDTIKFGYPSSSLQEACVLLSKFSNTDLVACDYDGYMAAFVQAAKTFRRDGIRKASALSSVIDALRQTVRADWFFRQLITDFTKAGGMQVMVGIIEDASWPRGLLTEVCNFLLDVTDCSKKARTACGEAGCVEAIIKLVRICPGQVDPETMILLNRMATCNDNLAKFTASDGISSVVEFLSKINAPDNDVVKDKVFYSTLESACDMLHNTIGKSICNQAVFVATGGVEVMLNTIALYALEDARLSQSLCKVLYDIVRDSPANKDRFVEAKGGNIISDLVQGIKTHISTIGACLTTPREQYDRQMREKWLDQQNWEKSLLHASQLCDL